MRIGWGARIAVVSLVAALAPVPARALDEIQVYNAEIAEVGQWTIQQHLNYTFLGRTQPDFPGGLVSNHSLQGTPELAYGLTKWWEIGFYAPFAVTADGQFLSNGAKIRNLFVVPDAAKRDFFYGVNIELSYQTPPFSQSRYAMEIRPIVGVRNKEWEFIVNPIVDLTLGEFDTIIAQVPDLQRVVLHGLGGSQGGRRALLCAGRHHDRQDPRAGNGRQPHLRRHAAQSALHLRLVIALCLLHERTWRLEAVNQ